MAAVLLDSFVSLILVKLTNAVGREASPLVGVASELEALEGKIRDVRRLLKDADHRELQEEAVRLWLAELRDVVYDANDIVDDFGAYGEVPLPSEKPYSSSASPSLPKLLFQQGIRKRIKAINKRLDDISRENEQLKLTASDGVLLKRSMANVNQQTSMLAGDDVVGVIIEVHARSLIDILSEHDRGKVMSMVAITGMGGIGKTTLAQRICNDEMIKFNFRSVMWVCISKEYDEIRLLREVIQCAGGDPSGNSFTKWQLAQMLSSVIHGKKVLFVLDDVWSADVWAGLLKEPFQNAAAGSKILVTSRFETVARQMGASHIHLVERMSVEDGWALLCKKAFAPGEELQVEDLKDVGAKIVEICGGLPLAIKLIGGSLRGRADRIREWEEIIENPVWNSSIFSKVTYWDMEPRAMEALYLSYVALPSHLKQWFLYLSLFPEDHVFIIRSVVQHWIAEGFVETEEDSSPELEAQAKGYFTELIHRSLLQPALSMIENSQAKVHDLLRYLAQFLAEGENLFGDASKLTGSITKIRRLSIPVGAAAIDLEMIKETEFLRSLYLRNNLRASVILTKDAIQKLLHLRLLDLSGSEIGELPDAMRDLVHLRYLNISGTPIRELAEWIGDLKNLQFLLFNNCKKINAVPASITRLQKLRCLEAYDGTELDKMPKGISGLVQLRKLIDFHVEHDGSLDELAPLVNLRLLGITKLERILDREKARNAAIKDKKSLEYLSLECVLPVLEIGKSLLNLPCSGEEREKRREIADVFEGLCPPSSLQVLNIIGYTGLRLPSWMWPAGLDDFPLQNLTWVGMVNCICFSELPPLGSLPHLKSLCVVGASAVTAIGSELMVWPPHPSCSAIVAAAPFSTVFFPKLENLIFQHMPNLEEWNWKMENNGAGVTVFPCLQSMYIENCPKLRSLLPEGWGQNLHRLIITECPVLKVVGGNNNYVPGVLQIEESQIEALPPWIGQFFSNITSESGDERGILSIKVKFDLLKRIVHQKQMEDHVSGGDWKIIEKIRSVYASATDHKSASFRYMKGFSLFETNIELA